MQEARALGIGVGMPRSVPEPRPEWYLDGVPKENYTEEGTRRLCWNSVEVNLLDTSPELRLLWTLQTQVGKRRTDEKVILDLDHILERERNHGGNKMVPVA